MGAQPDWTGLRMWIEGTTVDEVPEDVRARYNIPDDPDQLVEELLDQGIEQCPGCGTWVESGEVIWDSNYDEIVGCDACY